MSLRLFAIAGAAMFALDQASKFLVVEVLDLRNRLALDVVPPVLRFRMGWNEGVNFGFLSGQPDAARWILIAVAVVLCAWVTRWALGDGRALAAVSGGLLVGGALGNAVDRLRFGAVADFLNMSCCGINNPFAFNIADIGVFAGAIGLVILGNPRKPS